MNNVPAPTGSTIKLSEDIVSSIVLNGDLSKLNPLQKVSYYNALCERIGLDPTTQPFKLLRLNNKEVLYADKGCAQQLCKIYNISTEVTKKEKIEDVYCVTVRAIMNGRHTDEDGAVTIDKLKGDNLANAMMKAVTKAKRRAVLALMGLGMLDETEIETIKGAQPIDLVEKPREPLAEAPLSKTMADIESEAKDSTTAIVDDSRGIPVKVQTPFPIIGQAAWDNLVLMALKNGWTETDIAANVRSLGYKATRKFVPLNASDFETVEMFFSCKKLDYEKTKEDLK